MKKSMTIKPVGKIREALHYVKKIIAGGKESHEWRHNGESQRFGETPIYFNLLKKMLVRNVNPKILILGPGIGEEVVELNKILNHRQISPEIESFGITNQLTANAKRVIRKDYSRGLALEELDPNNQKHKELITNLRENFDYVIAPTSIGIHTKYPAYNCFLCALALKPKGEAQINVMRTSYIQDYINYYGHQLKYKDMYELTEEEQLNVKNQLRLAEKSKVQISRIVPTIYRFLKSYFKTEIKDQFTVELIPDDFNSKSKIISIKRNY